MRWYWSPGLWLKIGLLVALAVLGSVYAVATASTHTTWWAVVAVLVVAFGVSVRVVVHAMRSGVRETPQGIRARSFGRRLEVAWGDIAAFVYQDVGMRECVVVECVDGSRKWLYGACRVMRWRGHGKTVDLVSELNGRLLTFQARAAPPRENAT